MVYSDGSLGLRRSLTADHAYDGKTQALEALNAIKFEIQGNLTLDPLMKSKVHNPSANIPPFQKQATSLSLEET